MDKCFDWIMCVVFSFVFGFVWGSMIYWYDASLGVSVGFCLFFLCMLVLLNNVHEKEEKSKDVSAQQTQHNRRFNDA